MTDRIAFSGKVEADGRRLRGEVVLSGSRTWRNNEWLEIDPAALVKADVTGLFASWEHDDSKPLASTTNGSLRVNRTETGFTYETDELPDTTYANDGLELVRLGLVGGTSFEIESPRAVFRLDPDGTRVRRITSIKRLRQVGPVRDPAFANTTVAAFSKESDVTDVIEKTEAAPPAAPEQPATFAAPKDDKSDLYKRAEAFARDQTLDQLAEQMGNIIALGAEMSTAETERYDAFSAVYEERKKTDRDAKDRFERIRIADEMRRGVRVKAPEGGLYASDDYSHAFTKYLRGDVRAMEQFAQSISGGGPEGGFTVPDGFVAKVTQRLKAYGGIAGVADEITTSTGESLRWPYLDDTANSAVIASEGAAPASGGADLVFDSIELGAFTYASTGTGNSPLKVSLELLQDSAVDIEKFVSDALGTRIGRKQAVDLATGMGGTEPFGLLSKTADTMTATAVSLAGPEHIFQVDSEYRNGGNCRWIMSDTTLAKLWTSQATTNEPLFQPGRTLDGKPFDVFFGYPITIDPAAGNLVAFGDIKAGYIIRRVRGIQVLVDPYTAQSTRQIAYHAWARMDANIQDANAYSVSTWASVSADT